MRVNGQWLMVDGLKGSLALCGRLLLTALLTLILTQGKTWAAEATVVIAERSEVQGKVIKLGDIAHVTSEDNELSDKLSSLEIQNAPPPGQTVTIDPNFIRLRLRQKRLDVNQIQLVTPQKIIVTSRAHVVPGSAMVEKAKEHLLKQPEWAGKEVVIDDPKLVEDVVVPPGEVELKPRSRSKNQPPSLVAIEVYVDGQLARTVSLYLKVHVFAEVIVAVQSLSRRDVLSENNVVLERRDLSHLPSDVCLELKGALGKRLTRTLAKGQVLTKAMLEAPPDVPAKSKVNVTALVGQVKVSLVAEALEDGWVGKVILVRNPDSKKTFRATVVGEGEAVVKL